MRKHLARILVIISIFTVFFALSVNAKEVESEYSKGITILDEIPTSITYGDTAPVPRIKINGVTYEPGSYSCMYTFAAPDTSGLIYPDYMTPLKSGTCYVGIDVSNNLPLWELLSQLNGLPWGNGHSLWRIASFEVENVDISKCTADPIPDVVFDPTQNPHVGMTVDINLYFNGRKLTWQDFDVEYENNKKAGTATAIAVPDNSMPFKGQKKLTFKILPFEFDETARFSDVEDQKYTGNPITQSFTLFPCTGGWSVPTSDYTVTYSNNVNVGTATIKVTGKGSYTGTVSTTFKITPEDISKTTNETAEQVYTGSELKPAPVIKYNGNTLTAGKDYKVTSYSNNIDAGYGEFEIQGMGNFQGTATRYFSISPADISKVSFTYTPVVYNYNRSPKWEGVTVKYKSKTLTEGTDYRVDRYHPDGLEVKWKVTGKNNFQGETMITQTLQPMDLKDLIGSASILSCYYTGSSIKPTSLNLKSTDGYSLSLTRDKDYKLSYGNNTNAGQGTVTMTGIGKFTGTYTINFTIDPKNIYNTDVEIANIEDQIYTGSPITPEISAVFNGKTLVKDKDYTLSYSKNTAAGTATVTITGKGNFTGSKQIKFKIVEVHDISVSDIPNMVVDYGERPTPIPEVTVDGKKGVRGTDFTISWDYSKAPACMANVRIKVTGETISKPFALKYDINSVTVSDISDVIATGSAIEPEITITAGTTVLKEGTHYTLSCTDNVNAGTATVTISGINNFTGSREVSFTILAPTSTPTVPPTETPTEVPEETATPVPTEGPEATATPSPEVPDLTVTATPFPEAPDVTVTATPSPAASDITVTATASPAAATEAPSSPDPASAGTEGDSATAKPKVSATPVPADSKTAVIKGNTYKITGKKTAALLKASKKAKTLSVPATVKIKGKKYKVTAILKNAAKKNLKLKSLTIGKNVRRIGKNAFYGCRKLKKITVKTTYLTKKSVGKNAFKGINAKARVKVSKKKLKSYKTILKKAGIKGKKQKITK